MDRHRGPRPRHPADPHRRSGLRPLPLGHQGGARRGSKVLPGPKPKFQGDRKAFVDDLRKALYASKIVSYAQGYTLMRAAAKEHRWNLNYGGIALMWRGGCIIRSVFLGKIKEAFDANPGLANLLLDPFFRDKVVTQPGRAGAGSSRRRS